MPARVVEVRKEVEAAVERKVGRLVEPGPSSERGNHGALGAGQWREPPKH